ncbi:MAG: hypothetical protein KKC71_08525 [Chloroflexi bacterium]|nr:hypothetical protein [Chloroflexota bacterium]
MRNPRQVRHESETSAFEQLFEWLSRVGLAFTVSPVMELAKWMERRVWFGEVIS